MVPILILGAVTAGLVCGRLYSFMALLLTGPLLALVGCLVGNALDWGLGSMIALGAATMLVSQAAFLAGARLRVGRSTARNSRPARRATDTGKRNGAFPTKTTTV